MATKKSAHISQVGMKETLLPLVNIPVLPEIGAIGGLHPIKNI